MYIFDVEFRYLLKIALLIKNIYIYILYFLNFIYIYLYMSSYDIFYTTFFMKIVFFTYVRVERHVCVFIESFIKHTFIIYICPKLQYGSIEKEKSFHKSLMV